MMSVVTVLAAKIIMVPVSTRAEQKGVPANGGKTTLSSFDYPLIAAASLSIPCSI